MTLREAMDRLFDDAFTRPLSVRDGWSMVHPAIDMYQTDNEVVVKASLPGIKADEVQINVTGDVLTLKGEVKQEEERRRTGLAHPRPALRLFERSVASADRCQGDMAEAMFENGVLTITLPKADEVKPKTINIKAK